MERRLPDEAQEEAQRHAAPHEPSGSQGLEQTDEGVLGEAQRWDE